MSDPLLISIQELRTTCEAQQRCIDKLTQSVHGLAASVGLLVESVSALMGEELGTPAEPERETDMDGNPI